MEVYLEEAPGHGNGHIVLALTSDMRQMRTFTVKRAMHEYSPAFPPSDLAAW